MWSIKLSENSQSSGCRRTALYTSCAHLDGHLMLENCREIDVGQDLQSPAWALVLAQNRRSAIHSSPALKQAILALERSGVVVAERDMEHCDLALSCKLCVKLCIVQATMVSGDLQTKCLSNSAFIVEHLGVRLAAAMVHLKATADTLIGGLTLPSVCRVCQSMHA